ncbi:MAG: excinuclease ABC subunit UvrA, partial [Bacteroidetes bacterium]|nr:excinuclease ABC subunit UvrA [Bacteroidota bacterium]
ITNNPRSTVGTTTEIYDYLKILFTRVGKTFHPETGNEVKKHTVSDIIDLLKSQAANTKAMILCPIKGFEKYGIDRQLKLLFDQGYTRLLLNHETIRIEDVLVNPPANIDKSDLLLDRITCNFEDDQTEARYADSLGLAFAEGDGECAIYFPENQEKKAFSNKFEIDNTSFIEPSVHFFTFNNPFGACRKCDGYGSVIGIDPFLVIPDQTKSVFEGGIAPWRGESMGVYLQTLIKNSSKFDFPIHRPIEDLTEEQYELLWTGNEYFAGLHSFFKDIESQTYKIQYRVMLSRFRGKSVCPDCRGTRLRKDANYVKIEGKSITDIVLMPINESLTFFQGLDLMNQDAQIAKRILPEVISRLQFLCDVGLTYLTLNRAANSLSGGESQRINLATSLGSTLVGSMYVLDEPSIGLHPKDTARLVVVLKKLRDLGNTVIIVEHEEDVMKAADEIIDIGPGAGRFGGTLVFQGNHKQLLSAKDSLTADYLNAVKSIPLPLKRRTSNDFIQINGARKNNLKNINVRFPLHQFVCVTGVSGSGKSTLVRDILLPNVKEYLATGKWSVGPDMKSIDGSWKSFQNVEFVDQNPIGKSSRSNPATYVKAFDDIRDLFSRQPLSQQRGYSPGFFSFNVEGGRCEMCEGEGEVKVSMQFMADLHLPCETCNGARYKEETLEVLVKGKNISDILQMDVAAALEFFGELEDKVAIKVIDKIKPFSEVGLDYVQLGQSSSTLSGGEAQRVKLASFLIKGYSKTKTLFIFDEPTTGLHFHDIRKLVIAFNALVNVGHSVIVIEHNLDVIKCADTIIDLGPEGGKNGGNLLFVGTPEELIQLKNSPTGVHLKNKL